MGGDREFAIESDHGIWPRRLLHIPTMTSLERQEGNIYGDVKEPPFSVLSYTWGRWEIPDGPALPVKGTTWKIPSIDPTRFTAKQFQNVLERIMTCPSYYSGQGLDDPPIYTSFVWIDVACIDQVDRKIKMEEIGNQAGIFNMSTTSGGNAFVWLHGTTSLTLHQAATDLDLCEKRSLDDSVSFYRSSDGTEHVGYLGEDEFPACLLDNDWVATVKTSLQKLLCDPWFSSLWTLQEAHLSPEAIVLSSEGEAFETPDVLQAGLGNVLASCGNINNKINQYCYGDPLLKTATPSQIAELRAIQELAEHLPLDGHENPVLLYTSASLRTCREPLDRIYAIMQVFNLRLGETADPARKVTLPELELELALALNQISPVWGQYFLHRKAGTPGKSWCITQSCWVPPAFRFEIMNPSSECRIFLNSSGSATFKGWQCALSDMNCMWTAAAAVGWKQPSGFWLWKEVIQCTALDQSDFVTAHFPLELQELHGYADSRSHGHRRIIDVLLSCRDENFMVFGLGKIGYDGDSDLDELQAGDSEWSELGSVGLLVREVSSRGQTLWERVGLCIWGHLGEAEDASVFEDAVALLY